MPDICLQHELGLLLVDGRVTFASSHDAARMDDPAVRAERAKINLIHDAPFDRELPRRPVSVIAILRDGTSRTFEAEAVRGTFGNPMSAAEIEVKALDLLAPVIGEKGSQALYREVMSLDKSPNLRAVSALLAT